ncbi:nucleotidyltransferase domain-containing protein, partial [Mariprofundus ferrooxydans]|nr:nucleotidyltransferase domain-containing protein [Mariprofundus ferrooxydans]
MAKSIQGKLPGVEGIYVFGSTAKGMTRLGSDIDLAVLSCTILPVMDVWLLAQALARDAGIDVDLIDLGSASTVMRMQVIAEGQRLICTDDEACTIFEDFVFSDYARLNEERADILKDIQLRGSVYG